MTDALFSRSWYRVAELRPRLRSHARIRRHVYRDRTWYVLEDVVNQTTHRFTPETYEILKRFDGERSVAEVWEEMLERQADEALTQEELISMLSQLHAADLLVTDAASNARERSDRAARHRAQARKARWMSPLAIRIPLWDPDRWLAPVAERLSPLFGRAGASVWLAVVAITALVAGVNARALAADGLEPLLAPSNLLLLWLVFPIVKAIHELGHALAARSFGVEVHEMGVMFLVFAPVPYVDASSANALESKHQRAFVAAAGMIVELVIASIALAVWLSAEPGLLRTLALNTFLIASVSTLLFNVNPLLRFDGYYILADLLEIPNLRERANAYVLYLVERYGFGSEHASPPSHAGSSERAWLFAFAVSAFFYRLLVMAFIALLVLDFSLVLGSILLAATAIGWLGRPLLKGVRFLANSPKLRGRRPRAIGLTLGLVATIVLLVGFVPLPHRSRTEGVVWLPDEALVRASTAGFVDEILATPGQSVTPGMALLRCRDDRVRTEVARLEARLARLEVEERRARRSDASDAQILSERSRQAASELDRAAERLADLEIKSRASGALVLPEASDLPGRWLEQGQLIGYVVASDRLRVRAIVPESEIDLVRERLTRTDVRLAEDFDRVHAAHLVRIAPSATGELPSAALGAAGGGALAIERDGAARGRTREPVFEIDFELPAAVGDVGMGGRAHLRLDLGASTLWNRGVRRLRQTFLRALDV